MKVAIPTSYVVADVATLKALTPTDGDIKYVESEGKKFYYESKIASGDHAPNSGIGFWCHDPALMICYPVDDNYDFIGNSATEVTAASIIADAQAHMSQTNGYYNIDFALYEFIRDPVKQVIPINEVDYTGVRELSLNMQRRETFDKGRLIKVEYFEDYDKATNIGTNKIMEVDMVYVDGVDALVAERTTTRKWYLTDNTTVGQTTVSVKKYTNSQGVVEGVRRRTNNINELKLAVPGLIMQTEGDDLITARDKGRAFFSELENEFSSYIAVDDRTILTTITDIDETVNHTWLDNDIGGGVTIETYIKDQIDY